MALPGKKKELTEEQLIAREFIKNMDTTGLADLGQVPMKYRDHVLMLCSPEQLDIVEKETLDRIDTDRFWQKHCETKFGMNEPSRNTWRESYFYEIYESKKKARQMKKKYNVISEKQKEEKTKKATPVITPKRNSATTRSLSFNTPSDLARRPTSGGIKKSTNGGNRSTGRFSGNGGRGSAMPALMKQSLGRLQNRSTMSTQKMH